MEAQLLMKRIELLLGIGLSAASGKRNSTLFAQFEFSDFPCE